MSSTPAVRAHAVQWRMLTDTVLVGALASVSKLAGGLKVVFMARYFGAGDALDTFLMAFLLPAFVADVVVGCFTTSLIPVLVRVRAEQGKPAMCRVASSAAAASCAFLISVAVLLALGAPLIVPLLASGFTEPKLRQTTRLFYFLLCCLPVSAFIATWRAVLNSVGVFALPALAPIATPLLVIIAMWLGAGHTGVYALCLGTLSGMLAEAVLLGLTTRSHGLSIAPKWAGWTPDLKTAWEQYLPLTAGVMISSACVIIDQAMAGVLGAGSVSALAYGNKLVTVGLAITATASGTVVLPVFSRAAATGDWVQLRRTATAYISIAFALSVPATVLLIYYSEAVVSLLFQHGAFDSHATSAVVTVQRYSLMQVPFSLALALVIRLCASLQASSVLARVAVIGFMANVAGNIVLTRWLGLAGIALSTACVQAISLFALVWLLLRRERRLLP